MPQTNKINWILILQGWAMIWVVIGHAPLIPPGSEMSPSWCDFLFDTAYSFHMPLFIFISGFLFYLTRLSAPKWKYLPMLSDKLKRFGIPYIVFTVIGIFIKHFFSASVDRPTELSLNELTNAIIYPNNGPMREFWFLATIMWYFALFPVWRKVLNSRKTAIAFLVIAIVLHYLHPATKMFALDTTCIYMIYFHLGICIGKFYKERDVRIDRVGLTNIIVTATVALVTYAVARHLDARFTEALAGIVFSAMLAITLDRRVPNAFSSVRNYTYQIFLMSIFVQILVKIAYARFALPYLPTFILAVVAGLYVPVLISIAIERQPLKIMKLCIGLK